MHERIETLDLNGYNAKLLGDVIAIARVVSVKEFLVPMQNPFN